MFNKKIKLILRSKETGKKIETIKFSKDQSLEIRQIAKVLQISEQDLFDRVFEKLLLDLKNYYY